MPKDSGFHLLENGVEPTAGDIYEAVEVAFMENKINVDSMQSDDITFCGYGEPLLRRDTICEASTMIKLSRHGTQLRVMTNGLIPLKESADVR
jgi:hypothetical protein